MPIDLREDFVGRLIATVVGVLIGAIAAYQNVGFRLDSLEKTGTMLEGRLDRIERLLLERNR